MSYIVSTSAVAPRRGESHPRGVPPTPNNVQHMGIGHHVADLTPTTTFRRLTQTIGFALADGDRERRDRLVEYFGGGNRSAHLRATLKVMESLRRAERLRELQATDHRRLAERGIDAAGLPALISQAYKDRDPAG